MSDDDMATRIGLQDFAADAPHVNPLETKSRMRQTGPGMPFAVQYEAFTRHISATLTIRCDIAGLQGSHKFA
jgi:hypothetical protein